MTLSYDMTFLALLLTGLYEPETITGCERCIAHPVNRHHFRQNQYFDYAADMNVLLTFYKCLDDWQDEKKLWARIFSWMLMPKMKKIRKLHPVLGGEVKKDGLLFWKVHLSDGCL